MVLRALVAAGAAAFFAVGALAMPALAQGPQSVAVLAAKLSPSVVNISSTHHVAGGPGVPYPTAPNGSTLNQYFDDLNPNQGQGQGGDPGDSESLGSGFIISADGLIVTNNHVVDGADQMLVYLTDGTKLPARLVGADLKTDLAVLKIDAGHTLPFVSFGDSDSAQVGDWVMAIGNPFGLGGSVTLGIVSARNRDIQSGPYDNFIQTDASINQGNSGGPLFDMNGKVVGINTAIIARGGASLGIGFAVPGNLAKSVVDQLAQFGETRRGWLGVGIQEVTDDIAASLSRKDTRGAMITDVTKAGPSDGVLQEGDIILEFDGQPIVVMRDLPRLVAETAVGKGVPLKVLRHGKEQTITITLGRLEVAEKATAKALKNEATPALPDTSKASPQTPAPGLGDLLGFDVAVIDDVNRKTYALDPKTDGLVVTDVKPGTDAYIKGFLSGFVISEVNEQRVRTVAELTGIVDAAKGAGRSAILFKLIDPTGTDQFIAIKLN